VIAPQAALGQRIGRRSTWFKAFAGILSFDPQAVHLIFKVVTGNLGFFTSAVAGDTPPVEPPFVDVTGAFVATVDDGFAAVGRALEIGRAEAVGSVGCGLATG